MKNEKLVNELNLNGKLLVKYIPQNEFPRNVQTREIEKAGYIFNEDGLKFLKRLTGCDYFKNKWYEIDEFLLNQETVFEMCKVLVYVK